jgi:hypothetical protein
MPSGRRRRDRGLKGCRARSNEALHVLPADQRDVVAELLAVEVEEAVTVAVLLLGLGAAYSAARGSFSPSARATPAP